jgi:hypothetical protein
LCTFPAIDLWVVEPGWFRTGEKTMQQIQSDDLKGVSETLLIPLHDRVVASKSGSSGFKDEFAES